MNLTQTFSGQGADDDAEEIEISFVRPVDEEKKAIKIWDDPFKESVEKNISWKKLPKNEKNRIRKRLEGMEGVSSKYIDPEILNGYSVWDVVTPPYEPTQLAQLYDESAYLRAAIDARAMNTVGLGYTWEPTLKAKGQVKKSMKSDSSADRIRDTHQKEQDNLDQIFNSMNQEESFTETLIRMWLDGLAIGNGYIEVGRQAGSRKIAYLGYVPARLTRMRRLRDGYVQIANNKAVFFRNFGDTETPDPILHDPNPNELLQFKIYSPNSSYYGIPPSIAAIHSIIGDKFAKEFNIDYFENKAIPRYAIILKGVKLSEKSKKELIQYFRNEVKGQNHGTLVIPLPQTLANAQADVKFERLEADVQEASFDKYRKANRDEVVSVYRVPPTKVGIFDNANLAISRDADKTFKNQVVGPDQEMIQTRLNKIVAEFTDLFTIQLNSLDPLDEDLRSRINDRYLRTQVVVPNEVRHEINKIPIEGGDKPLPFPMKTGYQSGDPWPDEQAFQPAGGFGRSGGPPEGNDNSKQGSPPKSGHDNGSNSSNRDVTGQNAERGENQTGG